MQYMIIFKELDTEFAKRDDPNSSGAYWGAWTAYMGALAEAGIMVSGACLQPPHTASTVRVTDGQRDIHDGPYAETKEQLGGFCIIEVDSLDDALNWAAKAPCAEAGSVEVRPVLPPPPSS